jgi:DNA-binding GntR family transcriptional regulator
MEMVYNKIKQLILLREFVSGQRLSEAALSDRFGVSRTPVRDALRRLSHDGYINIVPNSGAWVASPSRREVEDTFAVRAKLEGWAAMLASHRISPEQLAGLAEKIETEDEIFRSKDIKAYLDVNADFHLIIAAASGNSVLEGYIRDVLAKTFVYMVFMQRYFDFGTNASLDEHRRIADAFARNDESLTVYLVETHVKTTFDDLISGMK